MFDVVWSGFKSSVFFCLSQKKCYIYDLEQNRNNYIAETPPVKSKLTNLAVNWKNPLLLIGDFQGGVYSFKLGQNLGKHIIFS